MADLWQDRAQLRALGLAGLLVSGCCPWAAVPFPGPSPSPAPALLLLPGWPQSSFHLISMCGRGGTRRVGKQHSHWRTHTLRATVYGCESYRNMCSAGWEEGERRRGEGETLRIATAMCQQRNNKAPARPTCCQSLQLRLQFCGNLTQLCPFPYSSPAPPPWPATHVFCIHECYSIYVNVFSANCALTSL